nr:winged helix-turn-helix transcriptional regulator [Brevibacillus panacihumi]
MTELGKIVGLSQPAVTERVRRLEEKGAISEYRAVVSPEKIKLDELVAILAVKKQIGSHMQSMPSTTYWKIFKTRRSSLS